MGKSGERDHDFRRCADRSASRRGATAAIGESIIGLIACRIPDNPGSRRGLVAAVLPRRFDEHRTVQRLGRLCAADRPPAGADIDLAQDFGALPEFRRHFHHDVVLVPRGVNGGHLPLTEGIVQRVIDLTHHKPKPRRGGTGAADTLKATKPRHPGRPARPSRDPASQAAGSRLSAALRPG